MSKVDYCGAEIEYSVQTGDVCVFDSYKIPHRHYHNILNRIYEAEPDCELWKNRSFWSLECEWAVHNACYKLGILREHTKDVNFNYSLSIWEKMGYHILGSMLYIWK